MSFRNAWRLRGPRRRCASSCLGRAVYGIEKLKDVGCHRVAPEQEGQRKFQSEGGASQDRGNASANRLRPEDKMPEAFKRRCIQDGDVAIQRRSLHPGDFGLELAGPEVKEAHLQAQQGQSPERATT